MKKNPLLQLSFLLGALFATVYAVLGILLIASPGLLSWLPAWLQVTFGCLCIAYAALRFRRVLIALRKSEIDRNARAK